MNKVPCVQCSNAPALCLFCMFLHVDCYFQVPTTLFSPLKIPTLTAAKRASNGVNTVASSVDEFDKHPTGLKLIQSRYKY
ncbi:hypothetical protein PM082_010190 [Marasmius tenuissimus]|nr:hypothetical protein PM082_010190 [Marasmius tenuissimus]